MRQDGAQPVISMGKIVLQGEGAFKICDRLQVLEVFGRSPQQESAGNVSLGKVPVYFKGACLQWNSAFSSHTLARSNSKWRVAQANERVAWARAKAGSRVTAFVRC